jgi:hypothetical protein
MTKYDSVGRQRVIPRTQKPHPVWRGIGCLIMIIVPLIALALAKITLDYGLEAGWPIPFELLGNPIVPDYLWKVYALAPLWGFIQSQTNLYALLSFALLYAIVMTAFLSVAYSVVYKMVGPPQYSPLDAPPPKGIKVKRYKR